ncbi:hypothetical protein [Labilibacter marinus]|uniref:hypothetical protein n=1 Tax=Labilibacter marinus TaxID=1477105 RepID=UPI00117B964D|nr:hypothetical protein [Labilibacter marinus]
MSWRLPFQSIGTEKSPSKKLKILKDIFMVRIRIVEILMLVVSTIGLVTLFRYAYGMSNTQIIVLISIGVFAYLIKKIIVAYLNPPQWLFKQRYFFNLVILGLIGGVSFCISDAFFDLQVNTEIYKMGIIAFLIMIFRNRVDFKQLYKHRGFLSLEREVASGAATWISADNKKYKGRLVLTNKRLSFVSLNDLIMEFEIGSNNKSVTISKSKILKIPDGIRINDHDGILYLEYPKYWVTTIKMLVV